MGAIDWAWDGSAARALGWILVHFLWQGTVVAALAAAALMAFRGRDPRLRYAIACGALAVMVASPLATSLWVARVAAAGRTASHGTEPLPGARAHGSTMGVVALPEARTGIAAGLREAVEPRLPLLAWCWSAGVLVLGLRLFGGWLQVRRLSREGTRPVPAVIEATMQRLAWRLGVSRPVAIAQSVLVQVPMVVGYVRPVVLLPVSVVLGMPMAQLEALLAHELAHVRRHDQLVNFLQSVCETVLFYHPAVWWLSGRIRAERENCCDDLAVLATGGNALAYARALAELEQARAVRAELAMAATNGPLLARVRRLLDPTVAPPRRSRMAAVAACALLALAAVAYVTRTAGHAEATDGSATGRGGSAPAAVAGDVVANRVVADASEASASDEVPAERTVRPGRSIVQGDDELRLEVTGSERTLRARLKGDAVFSADRRDVERLSRGGHLVVEERSGSRERRLEIRPDDRGGLRREWFLDGRASAFGPDARALLGRVVPQLLEQAATGGGVRRTLGRTAEGDRAHRPARSANDHERRLQLEGALEAGLDDASLARLLREAVRDIRHDWEMAELLTAVARTQRIGGASRPAYFRAVETIGSEWDRRRAVAPLLRAPLDRPTAEAVLALAQGFDQDYERAELLLDLLRARGIDESLREAFVRAAQDMDSEWDRQRVLSAYERRR